MRNIGKLWLVVCAVSVMSLLCGKLFGQGAYRMAEFTSEEKFKHELSLSAGPAFPLGNTRSFLPSLSGTGNSIPQGAGIGGGVEASYRFYPIHYFYFGVTLFGQWYGYDYKQIDLSTADRIEHSGWDAYGGALEIGMRLPLGLYGLYFTAHIRGGYSLMCSPKLSAIYSTHSVGDIERPILQRSFTGNFYLNGGVGVQYRFRRHWLCHIGLDYHYMPSGKYGSDSPVRQESSTDKPTMKLSSFVLNIGATYAF